jgi:hypothetical protein
MKESAMLEIAGGIIIALAIIFIGIPTVCVLATVLWRLWVTLGIGFIIAIIAAIFAHYSPDYDAERVFITVWIFAILTIDSFWIIIHGELEKLKKD